MGKANFLRKLESARKAKAAGQSGTWKAFLLTPDPYFNTNLFSTHEFSEWVGVKQGARRARNRAEVIQDLSYLAYAPAVIVPALAYGSYALAGALPSVLGGASFSTPAAGYAGAGGQVAGLSTGGSLEATAPSSLSSPAAALNRVGGALQVSPGDTPERIRVAGQNVALNTQRTTAAQKRGGYADAAKLAITEAATAIGGAASSAFEYGSLAAKSVQLGVSNVGKAGAIGVGQSLNKGETAGQKRAEWTGFGVGVGASAASAGFGASGLPGGLAAAGQVGSTVGGKVGASYAERAVTDRPLPSSLVADLLKAGPDAFKKAVEGFKAFFATPTGTTYGGTVMDAPRGSLAATSGVGAGAAPQRTWLPSWAVSPSPAPAGVVDSGPMIEHAGNAEFQGF